MTATTVQPVRRGPRIPGVLAASVFQVACLAMASVMAARWLGPRSFGSFTFTLTLASLVALLLGLGTGTALRVLLTRAGDEGWLHSYVGLSVALLVVSAPTVLVLVLVLPGGSWSNAPATVLVATGALCSRQSSDLLHARGKSVLAITSAASSGLLAVLVFIALHARGRLNDVTALIGYGACYLLPALAVMVDRSRDPWRCHAGAVHKRRDLLEVGLPASGMQVGLLLVHRLDRVLLGVLSGPAAVGVYSVASSLSEVTRMLPQGVGQVSFFRAGDPSNNDNLARVRALTLAAVVSIAFLLGLAAPRLIDVVVGPGYGAAVTPLRILLVGEVLFSSTFIDSRVLLARSRQGLVGTVGVVCAGVAVVLYLGFIGPFAAVGAAVASVLVYALMSLLLALARRPHSPSGAL
jgi:O-antigen/teichoic acid export membrane protein